MLGSSGPAGWADAAVVRPTAAMADARSMARSRMLTSLSLLFSPERL
jgi:hypothetical protein